jgi:acetyl esterase/lipase
LGLRLQRAGNSHCRRVAVHFWRAALKPHICRRRHEPKFRIGAVQRAKAKNIQSIRKVLKMKKAYLLFLALIAGLSLISCASMRDNLVRKTKEKDDTRMLEIHSQRAFPENITEITDIPYLSSGDNHHFLDVYYPNDMEGPFPVIINIHGGGFISESKEHNKLYAFYLARYGFLIFNINYRLALDNPKNPRDPRYPKGPKVPAQIPDVMAALEWIGDHIEQYPANREKIYIIGASAGAYLATMATLTSESERLQEMYKANKPNLRISALAVNGGFMQMESKKFKIWAMRSVILEKGYKKKEYYQQLIFKNLPEIKNLPPVFITSNKDDIVNYMSFYFEDLLKKNNIEYKFYYIANSERKLRHCFDVFNPHREEAVKLHKEMLEYLMQY